MIGPVDPGGRHDAAHSVGVMHEVLAVRLARPEVHGLSQMAYLGSPEESNCHDAPILPLHVGHAPQPCRARVMSAIAICSSRVARSALAAYLRPPLRSHVFWSNCTPPTYPLPVVMAHFRSASPHASASQVPPLETSGPSVPGLAPILSTPSRAGAI